MKMRAMERFWWSPHRSTSPSRVLFIVSLFLGLAVMSLVIVPYVDNIRPRLKNCIGISGFQYLNEINGKTNEAMYDGLRGDYGLYEEDRLRSALVSSTKSITGYSLEIEACGKGASLAAPWLLEPRSECLPYYGKTDMTTLAKFQAKRIGRYDKALSVIFFSASLAEVAQNAIFSMVKFGGAANYIVACWNSDDLSACQDLNLPCADASSYLARDLKLNEANETAERQDDALSPGWGAGFGSTDYKTIVWAKPAVVLDLLDLGYVVHSTDVDLAYGPKDIWESYMAYIESVGADGAIQLEASVSPINTGNFVILPTKGGKSFMRSWINESSANIDEGGNQVPLSKMMSDGVFDLCETLPGCSEKQVKRKLRFINHKEASHDDTPAIFRIYRPPWWGRGTSQVCRLSGDVPPPVVDPCHPMFMFVHPVCTKRRSLKLDVIREMGFWFMEEDPEFLDSTVAGCPIHNKTRIPLCKPREDAGAGFEKCKSRLAFSGQLW